MTKHEFVQMLDAFARLGGGVIELDAGAYCYASRLWGELLSERETGIGLSDKSQIQYWPAERILAKKPLDDAVYKAGVKFRLSPHPYGLCPHCHKPGTLRERRPDGNDICEFNHIYPSKAAL